MVASTAPRVAHSRLVARLRRAIRVFLYWCVWCTPGRPSCLNTACSSTANLHGGGGGGSDGCREAPEKDCRSPAPGLHGACSCTEPALLHHAQPHAWAVQPGYIPAE